MLTETVREQSVRQGMRYARQCFASRGNHSEIHITEADLAARFALMYEQGYKACATGYETPREKRVEAMMIVEDVLIRTKV